MIIMCDSTATRNVYQEDVKRTENIGADTEISTDVF